MAVYIKIRKVLEDDVSVEYEYGTEHASPGRIRMSKSDGAVSLITQSDPEPPTLNHFRRAERRLKKHWDLREYPEETCWAS